MASALSTWTKSGKPFTLCHPGTSLKATLERHGYTVGAYPDDRHLSAIPPEDHTPFSATGWPAASPYGYGMAIDIMPHPDPKMPTVVQIGAKILADRKAGVPGIGWLKYMNWTDSAGTCWNESWTPTYRRSSSSDRGHVHLSCRSDFYLSAVASGYDPVAALTQEDDMTPDQNNALAEVWAVATAFRDGKAVPAAGNYKGGQLQAKTPVQVDATQVAAAIITQLSADSAFIAAVAKAVNDDAARRLAS